MKLNVSGLADANVTLDFHTLGGRGESKRLVGGHSIVSDEPESQQPPLSRAVINCRQERERTSPVLSCVYDR